VRAVAVGTNRRLHVPGLVQFPVNGMQVGVERLLPVGRRVHGFLAVALAAHLRLQLAGVDGVLLRGGLHRVDEAVAFGAGQGHGARILDHLLAVRGVAEGLGDLVTVRADHVLRQLLVGQVVGALVAVRAVEFAMHGILVVLQARVRGLVVVRIRVALQAVCGFVRQLTVHAPHPEEKQRRQRQAEGRPEDSRKSMHGQSDVAGQPRYYSGRAAQVVRE